MITLPSALDNFMKGKDLAGLKPFAFLYRNKWDSVNNAYTLDSTPIDISALIVKPNTLSMTLDVNEIAQYNANNVTLTLSDTENRFVEGTPKSYFPEGYQLYGSRVVLYYGLNSPFNPATSQVNYTVVGTPVISEGIVSGFSANDYITLPMLDSTKKFKFHFDFNSSGTGYVYCLGATWNEALVFEIQANNAFRIWLKGQSVANVSNSLNKQITGTITYDGNDYTIKFSVNGQNYQNKAQNIGALSANEVPVYIGKVYSSAYFGGSINLKETYIKVNGQDWFNGAAFFYTANSTPLFTGVIKDLPTYKPEKYQVDLKLVSPLELLKDIEAKEFSNKVTGENLTFVETDSDGHKIYQTTGTGVGGFNAVYADSGKLFEGVDYEVSQINALGLSALITIINSNYYYSTISADYYTWKTGLTVEQIVAGLVGLAGYDSGTEDIRNVAWTSNVRAQETTNQLITIGYQKSGVDYLEKNEFGDGYFTNTSNLYRYSYLPSNFKIALNVTLKSNLSLNNQQTARTYFLGSVDTTTGIALVFEGPWYWQPQYTYPVCRIIAYKVVNGTSSGQTFVTFESKNASSMTENLEIEKNGNTVTITGNNATATYTFDNDFSFGINEEWNERVICNNKNAPLQFNSFELSQYEDENAKIANNGILVDNTTGTIDHDWDIISANITEGVAYNSFYRLYSNGTWADWQPYSLNSIIGVISQKIQFMFSVQSGNTDIENLQFQYLSSTLVLQLVNLGDKSVLEALQDFSLISGYEFGVDRQGVFFFRPRVSSTTPTYNLDHEEIAKVETIKKNLSDFFTKLTLTFAQVPLEFYANTGTRPTLVDKYGVINKEIDKPEIVNYDNPELAQAIGPQLLAVYSSMPNIIQVVGKLNLALELGDIVSLRRNFNLIEPNSANDYAKYITQQTYYRACKVTGMNYNLEKKQITYTLRDVSNSNTTPSADTVGHYIYELPIELGV